MLGSRVARLFTITATAVLAAGLFAAPTHAVEPTSEPAPTRVETYHWSEIEDVFTTTQGVIRSSEVRSYGKGGGDVTTQATGSGGSSTASGCRTVTVNNYESSTLGTLLYTYRTVTDWCWTRSTSNIYNVSNSWRYINDDMCWSWQGEVNNDLRFYSWNGGSRSGYLHWRQGHVQGGCIFPNNKYPENTIRAHSDGTYTWATAG